MALPKHIDEILIGLAAVAEVSEAQDYVLLLRGARKNMGLRELCTLLSLMERSPKLASDHPILCRAAERAYSQVDAEQRLKDWRWQKKLRLEGLKSLRPGDFAWVTGVGRLPEPHRVQVVGVEETSILVNDNDAGEDCGYLLYFNREGELRSAPESSVRLHPSNHTSA